MLRGTVISCLVGTPQPVMEWRIGAETAVQLNGLRLVLTNVTILGEDLCGTAPDTDRRQGWSLGLSFPETHLAEEWAKGIMLHSMALLPGHQQSKIQPAQPAGPRCAFCGNAATMASTIEQIGREPALTLCTACQWLWHKYPQRLHERNSMANELVDFAKNHCWDNLKTALKQLPSFINYKAPYRNYYILHHIAYFGALEMVRWLKTYLPNVDWTVTTNDGQTASQVASRQHKQTAALLLKLAQDAGNGGAHAAPLAATTTTAVAEPRSQDVGALFECIEFANNDDTGADRAQMVACGICFATTNGRDKSNFCMLCHSITCSRHLAQVSALNLEYYGWMPQKPPPSAWHICLRCYNKNWWLNRPIDSSDIAVQRVQKGVLPDWFRVQFVWQRWGRAKWVVAIPKFTILALLNRMEFERVRNFSQLIRNHSRPVTDYPDASSSSPSKNNTESVSTMIQSLNSATQLQFIKSPRAGLEKGKSPRGSSKTSSPKKVQLEHMLSKIILSERLVQDVVKLCLSPQCVDLCRRFIPIPPVWDTNAEVFKGGKNAKVKVPEDEERFIDLLVELLASEQVWICQLHCLLYRLEQNPHQENSSGQRHTLWFLAALINAVRVLLKQHRRMQRWMRAELTQMQSRRQRPSATVAITHAMVTQVSAWDYTAAIHNPH